MRSFREGLGSETSNRSRHQPKENAITVLHKQGGFLNRRLLWIFFRDKVFQQILTGNISINDLKKSQYFPNIQKRIEPFIQIENFLDSNKLIFRYNQKLQTFSLIEAEYLLSTPYENTDIYIFLDRQKEPDYFFCRSFFQKEEKDYTKGQAIYTLLIKEKINLRTEEKIIQYDRLTPKSSF